MFKNTVLFFSNLTHRLLLQFHVDSKIKIELLLNTKTHACVINIFKKKHKLLVLLWFPLRINCVLIFMFQAIVTACSLVPNSYIMQCLTWRHHTILRSRLFKLRSPTPEYDDRQLSSSKYSFLSSVSLPTLFDRQLCQPRDVFTLAG